ncbi:MAG: TIGR03545 family protein [Aquificae bacterium]|nr:TIGR03545 family protein [Aquificota bacterium]
MKIFRWQGIIILLVLIALVSVFFIFFFDTLVKKTLEKTLSTALRRPVEIQSFKSNILSLKFTIQNIQVADKKNPYKNLVQIKKVAFDLSSEKLAFKKYHIENLSVEDIALNTQRKTPAFTKEEQEEREKKDSKKIPNIFEKLKFPSVEEILKKEKLKTVEVGKHYEKELSYSIQEWKTYYKDIQKEREHIEKLKQQIKTLENQVKHIKSLDDIKKIKENVKSLKAQIDDRLKKIKNLKQKLKEDTQKIQNAYKDINQAYKYDLNYLKNKYSLDLEGGINLAGLLFGDTIKNYLKKGISIYKTISPYLKRGEEKQKELQEKRYRLEGRYVKYVEYNPSPDFVIKEGKLSLFMFDSKITGRLKNFSDNQKIYKKPFEIFLNSKETKLFKDFRFYSKFDRTTKQEKDNFNLEIDNLKTKEIVLKNFIKFTENSVNLRADVSVLEEKILNGEVKFIFEKTKPIILRTDSSAEIFKQLFEDINRFFVLVKLGGTLESPSFKIKSDLDDMLSARFKNLVNQKIAKFNTELQAKLDQNRQKYEKQIQQYKKEFEKYSKLISQYESEYKQLLEEIKRKFDTKELQKKIKKSILKKFKF